MKIGPYEFTTPIALAPMAGISDRPFRLLCRRYGAAYAVSEMVASRTALWASRKTRTRLDMHDEPAPRIVQIAGADPALMAEAARLAVDHGADVIDINMGCPAKKVCHKLAGSALLRDEVLVGAILDAVVAAVAVPVTLKTRTGWDPAHRNGPAVARLAEQCGVAAITVHGRTRACAFRGSAEYDTIAVIKDAVRIPVIANGDIADVARARRVLEHTGADGLMIGRAAQGRPWLFGELAAGLEGRAWAPPSAAERRALMAEHLELLHAHYGRDAGTRIARKHVGWYLAGWPEARALRADFNRIEDATAQQRFVAALAAESLELAA